MDILPGAHANVLIYLISFIQEMFEWPVYLQNPEAKRRISCHRVENQLTFSSDFCEGLNSKSSVAASGGTAPEGNLGDETFGGVIGLLQYMIWSSALIFSFSIQMLFHVLEEFNNTAADGNGDFEIPNSLRTA
jgi:hypothetical protein